MIKRIIRNTIATISILLLTFVIFAVIDVVRFYDNKPPIFIIHREILKDGGTQVYYGVGYQFIDWKIIDASVINKIVYLRGKEKHFLFSWIDPGHGPTVELEKMEDGLK